MVVTSARTAATILAASLIGCGASRRTNPVPDDADGDMDADVDTDVDTDSGSDGDADTDSDSDTSSDTCTNSDCEPDVYPCERDWDCAEWWAGFAFCLDGFCCLGENVDGECRCGSREGTCPPGYEICCFTSESPEEEVCSIGKFCLGGDI